MSKMLSFISLGDNSSSGVTIVDDTQLVDLDETYKDPSDSAEVDTLVEYVKTGKLNKAGAVAAGVTGAESLEPGSTKYNAKLAPGFLTSLAHGFVGFIKKIIDYVIKGVNWFVNKVKVMTGWLGRERDLRKHNEMIDEINKVLDELGINYQGGPSLTAIFADAPYLTKKVELMNSIKPKMMDYKAYAYELCLAVPEYNQLIKELNNTSRGVDHVKRTLERWIINFRKRVKQGSISTQDIDQYFHEVTESVFTSLNYESVRKVIIKIATRLQDERFVKVTGELNVDFTNIIEALNKSLEQSKERFSTEQVVRNVESLLAQKQTIRDTSVKGVRLSDDLHEIKMVLSLDDTNFLEFLSRELNDQRIITGYNIVATGVSRFTASIKAGVDLVALIKSELDKMNQWINKVEFIVAFHAIENLKDRLSQVNRANVVGVPLADSKLSVKGMDNVKDSAYSETESFHRKNAEKHLPDLIKKINKVSQIFHMGVKIDV